jgi:hypothetical protein
MREMRRCGNNVKRLKDKKLRNTLQALKQATAENPRHAKDDQQKLRDQKEKAAPLRK